jgi:hypothetical protein
MFKFADLQKIRLGGAKDNIGLTSIGAGALLGSLGSPLSGAAGAIAAGVAGAAGGAYFGGRFADAMNLDVFEAGESELKINSSPVPKVTGETINLGYVVDTGEALNLPLSEFNRHMMVTGLTGVGKTVLGNWLFFQQIQSGAGVMFVDGKIDGDNLLMMWQMAAACGREHDLLVINPDEPDLSNTYNPLLHGDPEEVASRAMALTPHSENNPGTDFYRQSASGAVRAIVAGLQSANRAYNPMDIALMLQSDRIFAAVDRMMPNSDAATQFRIWRQKFVATDRDGNERGLDMAKMRNELGGLVNKIYTFGSGNFGRVCNSYDPEVVILDAIRQGKIIYCALPTLAKREQAGQFGKMLIGDLRSALGHLQKHKRDRPKKPFLCFFDEAGSYLTEAASAMLEQARNCNISLVLAVQTKGNYDNISPSFRQTVTGNTLTKCWFKLNEPDTLKWAEEMIGKERQIDYSVSAGKGVGLSHASVSNAKARGQSDSSSVSYSESIKTEFKVAHYDLMKLGKGECIVQFDGDKVYHVRIPFLSFDKSFQAEVGSTFTPNRRRQRRVPGVYAIRIAEEILDEKAREGGEV